MKNVPRLSQFLDILFSQRFFFTTAVGEFTVATWIVPIAHRTARTHNFVVLQRLSNTGATQKGKQESPFWGKEHLSCGTMEQSGKEIGKEKMSKTSQKGLSYIYSTEIWKSNKSSWYYEVPAKNKLDIIITIDHT